MRLHGYNPNFSFVHPPHEFDKNSDKEFLQYCLGATLYMPGTKNILSKILNKSFKEVTSIVMCFEDAIRESDLGTAEENVIFHLTCIYEEIQKESISVSQIPLIFLRVRNIEQFRSFSKKLNKELASIISGFVFPKFHSFSAEEYLGTLLDLNEKFNLSLYAMPIFEGERIAHIETRIDELLLLKDQLASFKALILNLRVGGTDFSSIFSVRRGINYSVYDIMAVRDCLSDIVNVFGRATDGYLISGPVWEYFLAYNEDDLKALMNHDIHVSIKRGRPILNDAIDGLLKEVILDKANGFVGKTIIHPSHARFVNALQCVTKEEFDDASQILNTKGGVIKSSKSNKMNEINPHRNWAQRVVNRAKAYGVLKNDQSYIQLIME